MLVCLCTIVFVGNIDGSWNHKVVTAVCVRLQCCLLHVILLESFADSKGIYALTVDYRDNYTQTLNIDECLSLLSTITTLSINMNHYKLLYEMHSLHCQYGGTDQFYYRLYKHVTSYDKYNYIRTEAIPSLLVTDIIHSRYSTPYNGNVAKTILPYYHFK